MSDPSILHLVDAEADPLRVAALLGSSAGDARVVVFGRVDLPLVEPALLRWPELPAGTAAGAYILARRLARFDPRPDVLCAYSPGMAMRLLRAGACADDTEVWIDVDAPVERYAAVLPAANGRGTCVRWFAADPTVERWLIARGLRPQQVTLAPAWLEASEDRFALRHRLRRRLRLDPEQFVAVVLPPVTRAGGAFEAVWGAMLAEKVEPRLRIVVPGASRETWRVLRLAEACRHTFFVRHAPHVPLAELSAIADVGLLPARAAVSQTGLLTAAAAALPLVASREADAFGLLEANETLREVHPAGIARALLALLRDRVGMRAAGRRLRQRFGQIVAAVR